jgi:hypothetical protein
MEPNTSSTSLPQMPEKFASVIDDFLSDLSTTFPEYSQSWAALQSKEKQDIYQYCLTVYPERFFDILYQNDDIYKVDSLANTFFLPGIDFKILFSVKDISENTKKTMWKYLQLILITIMGSVKNTSSFGEAASLFEGIDEAELHTKLSETINSLGDFFKGLSENIGEGSTRGDEGAAGTEAFEKMFEKMAESIPSDFGMGTNEESKSSFDMPNAEDLHDHIKGIFNGKIGSLAKELAEELSGDVMDMFGDGPGGEVKSTSDIFKKMMKNPKKIVELIKKIGSKIDDKMKSGNISQEEMMKEASELMSKMKGMGNEKQFQEMMQNMMKTMGGMGGMGSGGKAKFDMNKMNSMLSKSNSRQKMLSKLEKRRKEMAAASTVAPTEMPTIPTDYILEQSTKPGEYVFKLTGESDGVQEKSFAPSPLMKSTSAPTNHTTTVTENWLDDDVPAKTKSTSSSHKSKSKKGGKKGGK